MRVMIVDHEPDMRFLTVRHLRYLGHKVTEFHDAISAFSYLQSDQNFDVIFSNTHMPMVDGYTFLRNVKDAYPQIPVIMLTVYEEENWREKCEATGADYCLIKPGTQDEIEAALRAVSDRG